MKKHIPNLLTLMNLLCGCISIVMALRGMPQHAFALIILAAVFDFCDGFAARILKAFSPIGKDLDSLADIVSFGVAPSCLIYNFLELSAAEGSLFGQIPHLTFVAFLPALFSALRLAKFNNDARQSTSFIGLPVPASALFWAPLMVVSCPCMVNTVGRSLVVLAGILLFSWIMVSEIPMFSLKLKTLSWKDNKVVYIFLAISLVLILTLGIGGISAVILWYIFLSTGLHLMGSRSAKA